MVKDMFHDLKTCSAATVNAQEDSLSLTNDFKKRLLDSIEVQIHQLFGIGSAVGTYGCGLDLGCCSTNLSLGSQGLVNIAVITVYIQIIYK